MADLGRSRRAAPSRAWTWRSCPVGSTEQHGPHLSLNVDTLSADAVAQGVSAQTGVPVLPALPYGAAWGHTAKWPGTLSLSPATVTQAVVEIGEWLLQGVGLHAAADLERPCDQFRAPARRPGNAALSPPGDAGRAARPVGDLAARGGGLHRRRPGLARQRRRDKPDAGPLPAGRSARKDRRRPGPHRAACSFPIPVRRTSENGATGQPTRATAAQGETLLAWAIEDLVRAGAGRAHRGAAVCP